MDAINIGITIGGIYFKNPVIAASGTFGFGLEYSDFLDLDRLGGITLSGLTREARSGNPPPRIVETPSGILNSVGLENPGIDYFIKEDLPKLAKYDTVSIANINGDTLDDYCYVASKLRGTDVDMIELNLSCPNVKAGGAAFGVNPEMVLKATKKIKEYIDKPLIVKLTPNVSHIKDTALAAEEGGADAISLINTLLGMAIDIKTRKPILGNVTGGLSGPAIKPIALRMVWEASSVVKIPVIGMGGIMTGEDVVEFLLVGATAVAVGTANLVSPAAMIDIIDGLTTYMKKNNIDNIDDLIGGLILPNGL